MTIKAQIIGKTRKSILENSIDLFYSHFSIQCNVHRRDVPIEIINIHFDTIDSTSSYAKREYLSFSKDQITCITADAQTAGRGRYQRDWVSPAGVNLYTTFYFRLPKDSLRVENLAQVMAHSLISLLLTKGFHPQLKWPNDILLNGKKISGILCETIFQASSIDVFLGIGINVNMEEEDLQKIDQPATSLKHETKKEWDRASLLHDLESRFQSDLKLLQNKGFVPFHNTLNDLLAYKGKTIRCFDGKKEWIGICRSLTKDGKLQIDLPDGTTHELFSGDLLPN